MIVCVVGPTGVGKTRLAEELSVAYEAIVVNCDAMQVYKEMNIGTAKYTPDEDMGQEHFLFDVVSPDEVYTVFDYQRDVRKVLEDNRDKNVVIVGGTGLYLKAGLYDYEFEKREETCSYEIFSNEELYELLVREGKAEGVHVNNRRRMISRLNSGEHNGRKDVLLYDDVYIVGLSTDRQNLYDKIDRRVDGMMENGLLDEVRSLYLKYGLSKAMKTGIGYKELVAYLKGLMTLDEAISLIKQKSRKYAKRQYTWFKYQMHVNWFETNYEDFSKTVSDVCRFIDGGFNM